MGVPEVSVVIPTRNRRELLAAAVASVLVERDVELELIVVDDASDDGTTEWVTSLADDRVRGHRNDEPTERSAARNVGLREARAAAVLFLDDDDLLCQGAVRRLLNGLNRRPRAVAAVGTDATFGDTDDPHRHVTAPITVTMDVWRELLWGWHVQPGAGVWRTEAVRAMGGWDENMSNGEDVEFNLRSSSSPFVVMPVTVKRYRERRTSPGEDRLWNDREIRATFLASLPGDRQAVGERLLRARSLFFEGMASYDEAEFRTAAGHFWHMFRTAPYLARSPILAPWLLGLLVKSSAAAGLPDRWHREIRRRRRDRRRSQFHHRDTL